MYDVNMSNAEKISNFCAENRIEVVGNIPHNAKVTEAMVHGKSIMEYSPNCNVAKEIVNMWSKLCKELSLEWIT